MAWRTGIATGEVVAGDATGGQRLVTGDAVNVAARLQQTAQPGEILITGETHRLVRDAVEVEPLGEVTVKGRQAPIETLRLLAVDHRPRATSDDWTRRWSAASGRAGCWTRPSPRRATSGSATCSPSWARPAWGSRGW